MNLSIIVFGIILLIVGIIYSVAYANISAFFNHTVQPNPVVNSIGNVEANTFSPVGPLLIIIGIIIAIVGIFI